MKIPYINHLYITKNSFKICIHAFISGYRFLFKFSGASEAWVVLSLKQSGSAYGKHRKIRNMLKYFKEKSQ